jgi:hypothetical protein
MGSENEKKLHQKRDALKSSTAFATASSKLHSNVRTPASSLAESVDPMVVGGLQRPLDPAAVIATAVAATVAILKFQSGVLVDSRIRKAVGDLPAIRIRPAAIAVARVAAEYLGVAYLLRLGGWCCEQQGCREGSAEHQLLHWVHEILLLKGIVNGSRY